MANNVQWIKIKVGMFDGDSFKRIKRAKIGGLSYRDKLTAVWFELLDLAGKSNSDGFLINNNEIAYSTYDDIAIMLDREEKEIELCIQFFISEKMVEIINDIYHLTNWCNYQNVAGLEKIREQRNIAQAKWRKKQKLLNSNNVDTTVDTTNNLPSIIELELELELDKDKESKNILSVTPPSQSKPDIPYSEIISYLNEKIGSRYKANTPKTRTLINARFKECFTIDDFKKVIDNKTAEWLNSDMSKYLRPETLFGTKFESYLNEKKADKPIERQKEDGFMQHEYSDEQLKGVLADFDNWEDK